MLILSLFQRTVSQAGILYESSFKHKSLLCCQPCEGILWKTTLICSMAQLGKQMHNHML